MTSGGGLNSLSGIFSGKPFTPFLFFCFFNSAGWIYCSCNFRAWLNVIFMDSPCLITVVNVIIYRLLKVSSFIGQRRGLAIGNGLVFYLMHFIPFVGWVLAPSYALIAATISLYHQNIDS